MNHNRKVTKKTDLIPSRHHIFEADLVKSVVKNKKILDIGCWSGQFLSLIEKTAQTFGVDPNKEPINFAKKYRKGIYKVGSALKLPFEDKTFDVVTMWDVIEHLPEGTEDIAIKEVGRVLKRKGNFCLCTVTRHPLAILLDPAFFLIKHRHYSEKYLVKLLVNHGFVIKKIVYSGGIWTLLEDNLNLIKKNVFKLPTNSSFLSNLVKNEYKGKGFVEIHIVAELA